MATTTVIAQLCEARAEDDGPSARRERRRAERGRRVHCSRTTARRRDIDESLGDFA